MYFQNKHKKMQSHNGNPYICRFFCKFTNTAYFLNNAATKGFLSNCVKAVLLTLYHK